MALIQAFIEAYQNGFYPMQTPLQTLAALLGNVAWHVLHVL